MTATHGPCPIRLVTDTATAARSIRRGLIVTLFNTALLFSFYLCQQTTQMITFAATLKSAVVLAKQVPSVNPVGAGTVHSMRSEAQRPSPRGPRQQTGHSWATSVL